MRLILKDKKILKITIITKKFEKIFLIKKGKIKEHVEEKIDTECYVATKFKNNILLIPYPYIGFFFVTSSFLGLLSFVILNSIWILVFFIILGLFLEILVSNAKTIKIVVEGKENIKEIVKKIYNTYGK